MAKFDEDKVSDGSTKLPYLEDGEVVTIQAVEIKTKKTNPPKPYSEDTLLADMAGAARFLEDSELRKVLRQKSVSGIGTAATRADTIEKLKQTKFITTEGRSLKATDKGMTFISWLNVVMPSVTDIALTAHWQAKLDEIAETGEATPFNLEVAQSVRELVATFQKAAPMASYSITTSKGLTRMTDTPRSNNPTDKMLEFAKRIATKIGVELPQAAMTDFDACKEFIDTNKDAAMRPSEKQLAFAQRIAGERGVEIPAEALADGRLLSQWLDEHLNN